MLAEADNTPVVKPPITSRLSEVASMYSRIESNRVSSIKDSASKTFIRSDTYARSDVSNAVSPVTGIASR